MSLKVKHRVNDQIRSSVVRLITPDGSNKGSVSFVEARRMASDMGLDLVEVSASDNGAAPVCKILDYGKLKYQKSKQQKGNSHGHVHAKEIKVSPVISEYDLERKLNQIHAFLGKRFKVRYVAEGKGRQRHLLPGFATEMKDHLERFREIASWDEPSVSDRSVSVQLKPI